MAINIYPDRIQFSSFSLRIDDFGLRVTPPSSNTISGVFSFGSYSTTNPIEGTTAGYTTGGLSSAANVIDRFPFATNANASDIGDLTVGRYYAAGQSSQTTGYTSGGSPSLSNVIDRFPFASNANATDVGDLSQGRYGLAGLSSPSNGYVGGGYTPSGSSNRLDLFPFATNANATNISNIPSGVSYSVGHASPSTIGYGYITGGFTYPGSFYGSRIYRFPFATSTITFSGSYLSRTVREASSQDSTTHGYTSGGTSGGTLQNEIDKFPFATNTSASDIGDLTVRRFGAAGQSSTLNGHASGGTFQPVPATPAASNTIDRFPFASDAGATDVGDLSVARQLLAGQQD